jgi:hypothetical protein
MRKTNQWHLGRPIVSQLVVSGPLPSYKSGPSSSSSKHHPLFLSLSLSLSLFYGSTMALATRAHTGVQLNMYYANKEAKWSALWVTNEERSLA